MPTITFSFKDLEKLVGRKLTVKQLSEILEKAKGELSNYDEKIDEVTISLDDTNLPYLWSAEGIARFVRLNIGLQKGIPALEINKSNYELNVDKSVAKIRPYITAFAAKGHSVDDYLLKQMIQLQEKLSEQYGTKRKKLAIGIYPYKKIHFPITYKATEPESAAFVPLDFKTGMTQKEILEEHPKGKEYACILEGFEKYPLIVDADNKVLSFPPIINSEETGRINENEDELFFEATGTDENAVNLACNIFAQALYERGFKIYSVKIKYADKTVITPALKQETKKLNKENIKKILGLELKDKELKILLEQSGYDFDAKKSIVKILHYRQDILHEVDVIEDIAIAYGYDKIKELPLMTYTPGKTFELTKFADKIRELTIGLGYQEVFSAVLSNKQLMHEQMSIKDSGTVELKNPMSETYSAVRSWLIPILLEVLSKNKHVEYPQKIFEQGLVSVKKDGKTQDYERISILSCNPQADYTEIRQVADYILRSFGIKYEIKETDHNSFILGRAGRIVVNGIKIGYLGEIHPTVLSNFKLEMPVAALEINLTEVFEVMKQEKKK